MSLQTLNTAIGWPGINSGTAAAPAVASSIISDAGGEYSAVVLCAREAMAISHVGFRVQTATGSPTADVRIETVDATTGLPTGTLWAANTNLVTGAISTGWNLFALTATANITKGQVFCYKTLYNSGTTLTLNLINGNSQGPCALPYAVQNTGTPTKTILTASHALALGSGAASFYHVRGLVPVSAIGGGTFNNTSSARRGLRFKVPFKCRAVGMRLWPTTAVGDFNIAIFDDAGNELSSSSTAFEGDCLLNAATAITDCYFDNAVTLAADTWYRAAIEPSSATNTNLTTYTMPSSSYAGALPGGANCHYTTYVASSWTDTATDQIPLIDILIDQFDNGVSGGIVGG